VHRLLVLGPRARPSPTVAAAAEPGDRVSVDRRRRSAVAVLVATVAPIAYALALVPLRDRLEQSISLLMVLPVLVLALLGGGRLAAVAAMSGAIAFGVIHTEPYYRFTIDAAADVVEMAVLLVVGVVTGVLTDAAQRSVVASRVRRRELSAMVDYVDRIGVASTDELVDDARRSIERLLSARSSRWLPGYRGTAAPVLLADGTIARGGTAVQQRPTGATRLPDVLEIPVGDPPREHGRIVVDSSDADVSVEERRAAATIARSLGRVLPTT
jgi:K+-sensing histidine kinase KdpD